MLGNQKLNSLWKRKQKRRIGRIIKHDLWKLNSSPSFWNRLLLLLFPSAISGDVLHTLSLSRSQKPQTNRDPQKWQLAFSFALFSPPPIKPYRRHRCRQSPPPIPCGDQFSCFLDSLDHIFSEEKPFLSLIFPYRGNKKRVWLLYLSTCNLLKNPTSLLPFFQTNSLIWGFQFHHSITQTLER